MGWQKEAFEALSGADSCAKGLSDHARRHEAGNFLRHAASLAMTKTADGLFDPKLVLSWLLTHLGAPSAYIGALVPLREAGALLPQLLTAPRIHAMARRKWAWVGAAAGQGLAALAITLMGVFLSGWAAGLGICLAVAFLALSRSVASVSYKDILGKTVGKARRGAATGLAASTAAGAVVLFALVLIWAPVDRYIIVIGALALSAAFWLGAAALFATLEEEADPGDGGHSPLTQLALLKDHPDLRRFIYARGLLTGSALAPPYMVVLAAQAGNGAFKALGALVLASATASLLSSYVWGRLADRSSRRVLLLSGVVAAAALLLALLLDAAGLAGTVWALPLALFVLMLAYHGVRQGRSTYLVDLAPPDQRTAYAAVANTVIGVLLLLSGAVGAVAGLIGPQATLATFAALCLAGAGVSWRMKEVEG